MINLAGFGGFLKRNTQNASELLEIAGSDMDLDKKVELLLQLYPGRVAED